jgi:hypothetical protein
MMDFGLIMLTYIFRTILLVAALLVAPLAHAAGRTALVVGNSAYPFGPLVNPANDAKLIAETLKQTGFDVTVVLDANRAALQTALLDFSRDIRTKDTVGLFYYAGHGAQVNGANYLIPVDADIKSESEVKIFAINVDEFVSTLERADGRTNIVILDSCRNNPFGSSARSINRGMALPDAPAGTFIALSTSPGAVALDGEGANSPYAQALAKSMLEPNVSIEQAFKVTRRLVLETTAQKQVPWETSSLTGDFFFMPKTETAAPEPAVEAPPKVEAPVDVAVAAPPAVPEPVAEPIAEPVPEPAPPPAPDVSGGYAKLDIQPQIFPVGKWPEGIVIANNAIYVAESGNRRMVKLDAGAGDLLATFAVGRLPVTLATDDRNNVYAAAFTDGKVYQQPPEGKGKVIASFKRPSFIRGMGFGNKALYVATSTEEGERTSTITRVDTKSGKAQASAPLGFDTRSLVMLEDVPWVLSTANDVMMLDPTSMQHADSARDDGFLMSMAANLDAVFVGGREQQQVGKSIIYRHAKNNPNDRVVQVLDSNELIIAIAANNDRVAALGVEGSIWILDSISLKPLKYFNSKREPRSAVFENGHLFITSFASTSTAETGEVLIYDSVGKID